MNSSNSDKLTIKHLEQQLLQERNRFQRQLVEKDQTQQKLQSLVTELQSENKKLGSDRHFLFNREKELKLELDKSNERIQQWTVKSQHQSKQSIELQEALFDCKTLLDDSERKHKLEVQQLKQQLLYLEQRHSKDQDFIQELQKSLAQKDHTISCLENTTIHQTPKTNQDDTLHIIKQQYQEKIQFYVAIQDNVQKLEEEKRGFERKIQMLQSMLKDTERDKIKLDDLKQERQQWTLVLEKHQIQSPLDLEKWLSKQYMDMAQLKQETGDLKATSIEYQLKLNAASSKQTQLEAIVENLEQQNKALQLQKSYDMEHQSLQPNFDGQQAKRLQDLEMTNDTLKSKLLEIESLNTQLKSKILDLEAQNTQLQTQVILMLKDNPVQRIIEERRNTKDVVMEKQHLLKEIEAKDKRLLRLKEVFGQKVKEYVDAVREILGYRMEMMDNGLVQLHCTLAKPKDPAIQYRISGPDKGSLDIVGGTPERVQFVERVIEPWIEKGSLPLITNPNRVKATLKTPIVKQETRSTVSKLPTSQVRGSTVKQVKSAQQTTSAVRPTPQTKSVLKSTPQTKPVLKPTPQAKTTAKQTKTVLKQTPITTTRQTPSQTADKQSDKQPEEKRNLDDELLLLYQHILSTRYDMMQKQQHLESRTQQMNLELEAKLHELQSLDSGRKQLLQPELLEMQEKYQDALKRTKAVAEKVLLKKVTGDTRILEQLHQLDQISVQEIEAPDTLEFEQELEQIKLWHQETAHRMDLFYQEMFLRLTSK
ncbi:hypothetical protein EDD86DRAFT_245032 [Gorgonomyces haynaldii]|nr:hypothetical protein EDD86DRAFT_245032 [Gorgonomyces haynaldii]